MEQNWKFLSSYRLTAVVITLPLISFTTEETTGCTNEAGKGASKAGRDPHFCFSNIISTFGFSHDFMILIISFVSSFKTNKVNPFPALSAPFSLLFLSNFIIVFEDKLLINYGKLSLAKQIARSVFTFLPKLPNMLWRNPPADWIF